MWLSCGADAATTHYALLHGGREVLIPTQNAYVIDGVAVGEAAATSYSLMKFGKNHPRAAKVLGWSIVAARGIVVANNINQLRK